MKKSTLKDSIKMKEIQNQRKETAHKTNEINSILQERYFNFFTKECLDRLNQQLNTLDLVQQFGHHEITYQPNSPNLLSLQLTLINESINSEVLIFEAKWGQFSMQISVLSVSGESPIHKNQCKYGAYGSVYNAELLNNQFVVKSIHFDKQKVKDFAPLMVFKEFIIYKIASVLGIGPQMRKWLGFDILMHTSCIQFAIEKCEGMNNSSSTTRDQLLRNIYFLHNLQIVHFDIKPENIMYSNAFEKVVLIDFGLSQIEKIKIGQTKSMFFRGTLDFCSPEMIQRFYCNQQEEVDIYYNDLFSLELTLKSFSQSSKKTGNQKYVNPFSNCLNDSIVASHLMLYLVKYYLFFSKINELKEVFSTHHLQIKNELMDSVLDFLKEFYPSQEMKSFYKNEILTHKKEGCDYRELNSVYQSPFSLLKRIEPNADKRSANHKNYHFLMANFRSTELERLSEEKVLKVLSARLQKEERPEHIYRLYLDYVSFSCNNFGVDMAKRRAATEQLAENGLLAAGVKQPSLSSSLKRVSSAILEIFLKILRHRGEKSGQNEQKVPRQFLLSLLFDCLEHIFILNIGSCTEVMDWIAETYNHQLLGNYDKIELILKIKHNNCWTYHRFQNISNAKSQEQCNYYKYFCIEKWCLLMMGQFKEQIDSTLHLFADVLSNRWEGSITGSLQNISDNLKCLPQSLQLQLRLQLLQCELKNTQTYFFDTEVCAFYDKISHRLKNKIFHFLFLLHYQYLFRMTNLQKCQQIQHIFLENLQCDELTQELITFHQSSIIFKINSSDYLEIFMRLLVKMDIQTFFAHIVTVEFGMNNLIYNIGSRNRNENLFQKIIQKLLILCSSLQVHKILQMFGSSDKGINHLCLNSQKLSHFIQTKLLLHILIKVPYKIADDFSLFIEKFDNNGCKLCTYTLVNVVQLEYQNFYYLSYCHQIERLSIEQLQISSIASSNKLIKIHEFHTQFQDSEHYRRQNLFQRCIFCSISPIFQMKYHGIIQFYYYLKEHREATDYLIFSPIHSKLLSVTLEVVYSESIQQMIVFLKELALSIGNHSSEMNFMCLFEAFGHFLMSKHLVVNLKSLFFGLLSPGSHSNKCSSQTKYNIIYFYILLFYLPANQVRIAKSKLTKYLDYIRPRDRNYMEAHYYRFLLWEKDKELQNSARLMPLRKYMSVKKKAIKMFSILNKKESKRSNKITQNTALIILLKHCERYGGPFDLQQPQLRSVRLKIKEK